MHFAARMHDYIELGGGLIPFIVGSIRVNTRRTIVTAVNY